MFVRLSGGESTGLDVGDVAKHWMRHCNQLTPSVFKQNGYSVMSFVAMEILYLYPSATQMEVLLNLFVHF